MFVLHNNWYCIDGYHNEDIQGILKKKVKKSNDLDDIYIQEEAHVFVN